MSNLRFVSGVLIVLQSGNQQRRGQNTLKVNEKCQFVFVFILRQLERWTVEGP